MKEVAVRCFMSGRAKLAYKLQPKQVKVVLPNGKEEYLGFWLAEYLPFEVAKWFEQIVEKQIADKKDAEQIAKLIKDVSKSLKDYDRFDELNKLLVQLSDENKELAWKYAVALFLSLLPCIRSSKMLGEVSIGEASVQQLKKIYENCKDGCDVGAFIQQLHDWWLRLKFTRNVPLRSIGNLEAPYSTFTDNLKIDRTLGWFLIHVGRELNRQFSEGMVTPRDYELARVWGGQIPNLVNMTLGQYHKIAVSRVENGVLIQYVDDVEQRVRALKRWLTLEGIQVKQTSPNVLVFKVPQDKFEKVARMLITLTSIDFLDDVLNAVTRQPSAEMAYRVKKKIMSGLES